MHILGWGQAQVNEVAVQAAIRLSLNLTRYAHRWSRPRWQVSLKQRVARSVGEISLHSMTGGQNV